MGIIDLRDGQDLKKVQKQLGEQSETLDKSLKKFLEMSDEITRLKQDNKQLQKQVKRIKKSNDDIKLRTEEIERIKQIMYSPYKNAEDRKQDLEKVARSMEEKAAKK